jgi:hypothetical protein
VKNMIVFSNSNADRSRISQDCIYVHDNCHSDSSYCGICSQG